MKKSKKALLWTIVPVLGVSSGVAGAVAGVTNQKTSVDTNNVATPSTATTMATRNSSTRSGIKITSQTRNVLAYSGLHSQTNISVYVSGAHQLSVLRYKWYINEGDGWKLFVSSTNRGVIPVGIPTKVSKITNWTFRCVVTETKAGSSTVTSEDIKFTIVPREGRWIDVVTQPAATTVVNAGEKVTLSTSAKGISSYKDKTIGYQWFEYDSSKDKFTEIDGATESSYTFIAPSNTTTTTTKYVCRYYIKDTSQTKTYLSESNQSIVTVNKDAEEKFEIESLKSDKTDVKVGDKITLTVEAKSTKTETKDLKYQWLKAKGNEYETISNISDSSSFEYVITKDDLGKELLFSVLVFGSTQDGKQNHFQGGNVKVTVSSSDGTSEATANQTFTNTISVKSSVTTNQASVRSTFQPIGGLVRTPEYKVDVKGDATGLTYKWYYVGRNGAKKLIENASSNTLKTGKSLFEAAYKDNDKHKVGIVCEIYRGTDLVKTVDQTVDRSFYMTVVITRK